MTTRSSKPPSRERDLESRNVEVLAVLWLADLFGESLIPLAVTLAMPA